jgi:hypothetical protein
MTCGGSASAQKTKRNVSAYLNVRLFTESAPIARSEASSFRQAIRPLFLLTISRPEHSVLHQLGFSNAVSVSVCLSVRADSNGGGDPTEGRSSRNSIRRGRRPDHQTILTTKAAPFRQCISGCAASMDVARMPEPRVRPVFPAYTAKRSESLPFWALCSFRC